MHAALGGELRLVLCSAAHLSPSLQRSWEALGVEVVGGLGELFARIQGHVQFDGVHAVAEAVAAGSAPIRKDVSLGKIKRIAPFGGDKGLGAENARSKKQQHQ